MCKLKNKEIENVDCIMNLLIDYLFSIFPREKYNLLIERIKKDLSIFVSPSYNNDIIITTKINELCLVNNKSMNRKITYI